MTLTWPDIRATFQERFGDQLPSPTLESELVAIFERHPTLFAAEANRAASAFADGKIRSPWVILQRNLAERVENEERFEHVTASDASERERAVRLAERWIRHAGHEIPDEGSLFAELFAPDEMTADVVTLERLESETRDSPGRAYFGSLLVAQLERTKTHGRQPIPGSGGPLAAWDSPELRARMIAAWKRTQPVPTPDDDIPF